jgi:PAS domain S-box-containing protein
VPHKDETRRRRAVAVAGTVAAAALLAVLVGWHMSTLRSATFSAARRQMTSSAARAARMLDFWVTEREGDATTLADLASIHGTDSTAISPAIAGRILHLQMESLARREYYGGIWMVGEGGRVAGAIGGHPLNASEIAAVTRALDSGVVVIGQPEARDSIVSVGIVKPIMVADRAGRSRAAGAVVLRATLNTIMPASGTTRLPATMDVGIVVPVGDSAIGLRVCGPRGGTLCAYSATDSLARVAVTGDSSFGTYRESGELMLSAAHRATKVPWGIYVAASERAIFAPMRDRLRFEALLFVCILLIAGLAIYTYDRSVHLRRLTERAQTEARFSAIVNTAMDAIIIVDERYDISVVNSAAEFMFGYSAAEAIGRSVLELMPQASTDELRRTIEQTLRAGEQPRVFSAERYAAGKRRDGSTFPIDLSISRTQIDGLPHLTIVIRDVTDWKRAEESSEWQRRVLESIATGMELRDVLTTIAHFHETQCAGVECAFHLIDDDGLTLRSASAPSMRPEFIDGMDEVVVGPHASTCGTAVYRREQVITADISADRLWNDYRALALEQGYRSCWSMPIRSPQGRVLGALTMYRRQVHTPSPSELRVSGMATQLAGIAVDRAHAAESLRQSEASFRSFVENSPIGIYRATGTGRLLAVNASLVQLLGYDSSLELLQVDMGQQLFVSIVDRDRLLRQLEAHGELRSAEMEWRRKDSTTLTVRISARAYRDERGSVWFTEGFVENVTPLRAAELALRQSEKLAALGQLVSGVAHELNNPLAAILHFAEDLLDDERTSADLEALSVIRDQARRSRSIVRDLLSFVRFRDASREHVQLTDALAASVKALQPSVEDTGAKLATELPSGDVFGNTDRAGLQQIVTNLVMNGAQASGRGGTVRLVAAVSEKELTLVVEDTGPGIPPGVMDRIFEPFFTTKPLGEGTGLGLSVTLGIVQQLGGKIFVENRSSEGAGTGARFTVTLPIDGTVVSEIGVRVPRSIIMPSAAQMAVDPANPPRALIIDDEPSIRSALRRFFTRRGWQVDEAEDGAEGLSAILAAKFDYAAVISDLKMPGCSGVELHDHVAAVAPELLDRIIFSTGDVASKEAAEFVQRTRCTVLQKPFELRALEAIVSRMRQMATV